jgi:Skp family chaperone for outer membrane proteins
VKRILVSLAAVAVLSGVSSFPGTAWGQATGGKPNPAPQAQPHKVGLIDMAFIFNNYKKFETLREDLRAEIMQSDQRAQQMAQQLEQIKAELQSGQFKPESQDYRDREKRFDSLTAEFNHFRRNAQREFLTKESNIYKTVYQEVTDAVKLYARYHRYTLIIRFNREGLDSSAEPADVHRSINSQVVFFNPDDDCTTQVLEYLNNKYNQPPTADIPDRPTRR